MIPIPKPEDKQIKLHCRRVKSFITKHTLNGQLAISLLNYAIDQVKKGITFDDIIKMEIADLMALKTFYDDYKVNKLPNLLKNRLTENDCSDYEEKNKDIDFFNEIISFKKMDYYYTQFEKKYGMKIMNASPVKVCPYCNRAEIHNADYHKTSQFDHFIPKGFEDNYPLFALSYYNLIPSCTNCNHIKLSKNIPIISPYDNELNNDSFHFDCKLKTENKISVTIYPTIKNKKFRDAAKGLNKDLELKKLYSDSEFVNSKFFKMKNDLNDILYNNYLDDLKNQYSIKKLNNISAKKMYFEIYEDDSDFLIYPYSKITKEIGEKFNLFYYLNKL